MGAEAGASPRSYAYVLQAADLSPTREDAVAMLADCGRDWLILDTDYLVGADGAWRAEELAAMRAAHPGRKILAYLSIGEAEGYRAYWQAAWDMDDDGQPDEAAPPWLDAENPDWPDNYKVRYWDAEWQDLVLARVDAVMAQGFDGVFLDIVDGFEYYERDGESYIDERENPATGTTYRQDMVSFVRRIAHRSRSVRPEALVIPQNGAQLLADGSYRSVLSGVALEDLFTSGEERQPPEHTEYILEFVRLLRERWVPVLDTEYPEDAAGREAARRGANAEGLVLLLTDRALDTLGVSGGEGE